MKRTGRRSYGNSGLTAEQIQRLRKYQWNKEAHHRLYRFFRLKNQCNYRGRVLDMEGNVVDPGEVVDKSKA